ncbi:hypothetical protein D1AOALGA4SA_6891 [Olavius algarvensis Delta 1 endosymbiont]|nr:hypothetical protein D1AOALGA4SA_6891 [Olavius algarvensis Delta 1 endosymbiont]
MNWIFFTAGGFQPQPKQGSELSSPWAPARSAYASESAI